MTINSRKYKPESDFIKIRDLIIESYKFGGNKINWAIDRWETQYITSRLLNDEKWKQDIFVWENSSQEIKSAIIQESPGSFHFIIDPNFRHLEDEMIKKAIDYCKTHNPQGEKETKIHIWAMDEDTLENKLQNYGFTQLDCLKELCRKQDITNKNTAYILPNEYQIRNINIDDINDRKKLTIIDHNCFPWSDSTEKLWLCFKKMPSYNEKLHIVAIAPDKSFAAFCILWYNIENQYAIFEPVGTHSNHRKKGLGKAVLLEALKRVKELGGVTGMVNSYGEPAHSLYESVGFTEYTPYNGWEKIIK